MKIQLDGKRALVTGGNSGIGEAIMLAPGGAGAKMAIDSELRSRRKKAAVSTA